MADLRGLIELTLKPFERAQNGISILHIVSKAPIQQIGAAIIESYLEGQLSAYTKPTFLTYIGDDRHEASFENKTFRSNLEIMLEKLKNNATTSFMLDDHYIDDDCDYWEKVKLMVGGQNKFCLMFGAQLGHITPFFDANLGDNNHLILRNSNGDEVVNEIIYDKEIAMCYIKSHVDEIRKKDKAFDSLVKQAEKEAR